MERLNYYRHLLEQYLDGKLPIEEFQKEYLTSIKQETFIFGPKIFPILGDLFEDVDSYSPLWSKEDESPFRLTEKSLRIEVLHALEKLDALEEE